MFYYASVAVLRRSCALTFRSELAMSKPSLVADCNLMTSEDRGLPSVLHPVMGSQMSYYTEDVALCAVARSDLPGLRPSSRHNPAISRSTDDSISYAGTETDDIAAFHFFDQI